MKRKETRAIVLHRDGEVGSHIRVRSCGIVEPILDDIDEVAGDPQTGYKEAIGIWLSGVPDMPLTQLDALATLLRQLRVSYPDARIRGCSYCIGDFNTSAFVAARKIVQPEVE